jgi:hypothetical protein
LLFVEFCLVLCNPKGENRLRKSPLLQKVSYPPPLSFILVLTIDQSLTHNSVVRQQWVFLAEEISRQRERGIREIQTTFGSLFLFLQLQFA